MLQGDPGGEVCASPLREEYATTRRLHDQSFSGPGSSSAPPLPADPNFGTVHLPLVVRGGSGCTGFLVPAVESVLERSFDSGFFRLSISPPELNRHVMKAAWTMPCRVAPRTVYLFAVTHLA